MKLLSIFLASIVFLFYFFPLASAQLRSADETRMIALSVFGEGSSLSLSARPYGGLIHVYDRGDGEGWVMVAADRRGRPVLAYRAEGEFALDSMSFQIFTMEYARQIADSKVLTPPSEKHFTPVTPLIKSRWGQDRPFSSEIERVEGIDIPTGCLAAAISQLLYYYRFPTKAVSVPKYVGDDQHFHAALPSLRFDFAKMKPEYPHNKTSSRDSELAVARLYRYVGNAVRMSYGIYGSHAADDGVEALVSVFGFDDDMHCLMNGPLLPAAIEDAIHSELDASRPVLMSIGDERTVGHAFLCDGSDAFGLFHANLGWSGHCDGYMRMQATADNSVFCNFSVFVGVMPDDGKRTTQPTLTLSQSEQRGDTLFFTVRNDNGRSREFEFSLAELSGTSLSVIKSPDYHRARKFGLASLFIGGYFVEPSDFAKAGLAPGSHRLFFVCREVGVSKSGEWHLMLGADKHPVDVVIDEPRLTVKSTEQKGDMFYLSVVNRTGTDGVFDVCIGRADKDGNLLSGSNIDFPDLPFNNGVGYTFNTNEIPHVFGKNASGLAVFSRLHGSPWRLCLGPSRLP
ncbi:MAG: C10 family peptidase [Bacteroidales bacterium]|nr:C10 family peptidase [Bacteroidales bacterium]